MWVARQFDGGQVMFETRMYKNQDTVELRLKSKWRTNDKLILKKGL